MNFYLKILFFTILWYYFLSGIDYGIHRYVFHNDDTFFKEQRMDHKLHHLESAGDIEDNGHSLVFTLFHSIFIGGVSSILILIFSFLFFTSFYSFITIFILNYIFVFIGLGVHNYVHTIHHGHEKSEFDNFFIRVKVPDFIQKKLSKHHTCHHKDPSKNFCVVFLGFDNLLGTNNNIS